MKVKFVRLVQEVRGIPDIPDPHAPRTPTVLYLMQLRSHMAETTQPKRKLVIPIEVKNGYDLHALPVKITHM